MLVSQFVTFANLRKIRNSNCIQMQAFIVCLNIANSSNKGITRAFRHQHEHTLYVFYIFIELFLQNLYNSKVFQIQTQPHKINWFYFMSTIRTKIKFYFIINVSVDENVSRTASKILCKESLTFECFKPPTNL